jgi:hypothetical protein
MPDFSEFRWARPVPCGSLDAGDLLIREDHHAIMFRNTGTRSDMREEKTRSVMPFDSTAP